MSGIATLYSKCEIKFSKLFDQTQSGSIMRKVLEEAKAYAPFLVKDRYCNLLLSGPSGSGKNLLCQAIHNEIRPGKHFAEINCAAIPDDLFESELYGHTRGAYTNAYTEKKGLLEMAQGGTLFLDEIGDLSLVQQAKLLRLVSQKKYFRVGDTEEKTTDALILCATNKMMEELKCSTHFRQDLYFRMNIHLRLPALRERPDEEIKKIVDEILNNVNELLEKGKKIKQPSECIWNLLREYPFPGNVRELESCIKRASFIAVSKGRQEIWADDLPSEIRYFCQNSELEERELWDLYEVEKRHVRSVLRKVNDEPVKASELLGIPPGSIWRKKNEYKCDFDGNSFVSLPRLVQKLKTPTDAVSQFIQKQFLEKGQKLLGAYTGETVSLELTSIVIRRLNKLLSKKDFYEPNRFSGIFLRPETQCLLKEKQKIRKRNRLLLEDVYPDEIKKIDTKDAYPEQDED